MEKSKEKEILENSVLELSNPSLGRFALHLAGDWLAVFAGFSLFAVFPNVAGFLAASVVLGLAQHALVVLGHEAVHYRACRNRALNEWIGQLFCFFPMGLTVTAYREFHYPHHRNTNTAQDPELPLRKAMGKNWVGPFTLRRGLKLWALSFLGLSLKELGIFILNLPLGRPVERGYLALFSGAVVFLAYRGGMLPFVVLWYFALATTYFSTLRIQAWFEHSLADTDTNRYSLPHPVFRLLVPHNIWVHYEHHKYPNVPFFNLEKVRKFDDSSRIHSFREMELALSLSSAVTAEPVRKAA